MLYSEVLRVETGKKWFGTSKLYLYTSEGVYKFKFHEQRVTDVESRVRPLFSNTKPVERANKLE